MLAILKSAISFITDPDARAVSPIKYPNGNAMSIREAKSFGLYLGDEAITEDKLTELLHNATHKTPRDMAILKMAHWNVCNFWINEVYYEKSPIEGKVKVKTTGPAYIQGDSTVLVPIETIGGVLTEKLEPAFDHINVRP
jgi:hypothetical protein